MPNYLKPQSPLKDKDGDYIYPLTTADQIIMGNGSRLVEDIESFVNTKINEKVISRKSRNLLPILNTSKTVDEVTFTVNPDRSITMNGTATNEFAVFEFFGHSYYAYKPVPITFHKGSKLIASYEDNNCHFVAMRADGTIIQGRNNINIALANSECTFVMLGYGIVKGTTINNITIYPMILAPGDIDETYEPYYNGLANIDESPVMSMDLLWENADPESNFAAKAITLDLSNYHSVYIIMRYATGVAWDVGYTITVGRTGCAYISMMQNVYRRIDVATMGVYFDNAQIYNTYNNSAAVESSERLIPFRIYGIKGVF